MVRGSELNKRMSKMQDFVLVLLCLAMAPSCSQLVKSCCQLTCLPLCKLLMPLGEACLGASRTNPVLSLPPCPGWRAQERLSIPRIPPRTNLPSPRTQPSPVQRDKSSLMALSLPPWGCRWQGQQDAPRIQTQLFPDQDLVLGFPPAGYRLQIPAWLILPLTSQL